MHTALWRYPPAAPPASPASGHVWPTARAALRDVGWGWTGVAGWDRVALQGCPGGMASGRAGLERKGGKAHYNNLPGIETQGV